MKYQDKWFQVGPGHTKEWNDNWERTFGKKCPTCKKPKHPDEGEPQFCSNAFHLDEQ